MVLVVSLAMGTLVATETATETVQPSRRERMSQWAKRVWKEQIWNRKKALRNALLLVSLAAGAVAYKRHRKKNMLPVGGGVPVGGGDFVNRYAQEVDAFDLSARHTDSRLVAFDLLLKAQQLTNRIIQENPGNGALHQDVADRLMRRFENELPGYAADGRLQLAHGVLTVHLDRARRGEIVPLMKQRVRPDGSVYTIE